MHLNKKQKPWMSRSRSFDGRDRAMKKRACQTMPLCVTPIINQAKKSVSLFASLKKHRFKIGMVHDANPSAVKTQGYIPTDFFFED